VLDLIAHMAKVNGDC